MEKFKKWAEDPPSLKLRGAGKDWKIDPVLWCEEGFFVNAGEEQVLGKDLLHQLGHFYMQEAASMLPIALLDPQPGEAILDLAAAPGSKTTQIASQMNNTGVILANDVQEKRLWILKDALQRSGVLNTIVTKKKGEWFGKHMTERFDRVLCDAPCSAQGVLRKDPQALRYANDKRIAKLANAQTALLESAIHAAKIGGRIVYSTCTLTPEENEGVVLKVLEEFEGKVEVLNGELIMDPSTSSGGELQKAIDDSLKVQKHSQLSIIHYPFLRLWPQTYDTEGFFCAVLQKKERTRTPMEFETIPLQEKPLTPNRQRDIESMLQDKFGTTFIGENETLFEQADQLILTNEAAAKFALPVQNYSIGLPFIKGIRDSAETRLTHEIATLRGNSATKNVVELDDEQLQEILKGQDTHCSPELRGEMILRWKGLSIGLGRAKEGKLKNQLPRRFVSV